MQHYDKLLPIRWGNGNGKGDEQIGDAKVRLNTFNTGGKRAFMAPGLTKCALMRFLPLLANIEKSCYLFKGSTPAPSISFLIPILCVLYLLVGLSTGCYSTCWFTYRNVLLNFDTNEKVFPWFIVYYGLNTL